MPLDKVFDENDPKYKDCKWSIYGYVGGNNKCKVLEYLSRIATVSARNKIIEKLEELAFRGPDELAPPSFDEAGDSNEDFVMYRIRKGQDRLYLAIQRSQKRVILTSGTKKKTNETAKKDKREFQNITNKVLHEEKGGTNGDLQ
jgi:hypothetical protein